MESEPHWVSSMKRQLNEPGEGLGYQAGICAGGSDDGITLATDIELLSPVVPEVYFLKCDTLTLSILDTNF